MNDRGGGFHRLGINAPERIEEARNTAPGAYKN